MQVSRLKIIQIFNRYLQMGGEEKSVIRIAEDLESGGHSVTRFWRDSSEWHKPDGPSRLHQPFLMWRNPAVLAALRQQQLSVRADAWVLHNIVPVVSLGVYGLARELGVPVIQWLHNYRPVSVGGALFAGARPLSPEDRWLGLKESWAGTWNGRLATSFLAFYYRRLRRNGDFASVRAWVAVSEEMRRIFERARWYPERLHTLRHSWHVQPTPIQARDLRDEGAFLFLGRMIEPKGVRFMMDLWRRPELRGMKLIMAGDGPLVEELRPQSPANVEWVGHVEGDVKSSLKARCRAIVLPSIWPEPLSTVVYEAYEMNKPVLASALGGNREVVKEGETGMLLPPGEPQPWIDAILRLAGDADFAVRLGSGGKEWLEREVSPQRWVQQFDEIARQAGISSP
jgi:glycosyltransferase involved in cell wall biosynthesis